MCDENTSTDITYCRITPGIGMARLGNSPTGLYIGPEHPDEVAEPVDGAYKDAKGRIKRQAARFRVFAYDKDDNLVRELTVDDPQVRKIE